MLKIISFAHQNTSVSIRERLTLPASEIQSAYLQALASVQECCLLQTCGRTTFLYVGETRAAQACLERVFALEQDAFQAYARCYEGREALMHVMRLACGLESAILGEPQILGQLKQAYRTAKSHQGVGGVMHRVMPEVFRAAKAVRTHTDIGCSPLALSCVVFDLATKVFDDLSSVSMCFIGAGETIERHLAYAHDRNMRHIHLVNRSLDKARALVKRYGGTPYTISQLPTLLEQVDFVVTATASPLPWIGKGMMERVASIRNHRPMLCVDLAVPRDIEPEVSAIDGVYLYNIEDLHGQIKAHHLKRQSQVRSAEQMLPAFIDRAEQHIKLAKQINAIRDFRKKVEVMRDATLDQALLALARGGRADQVLEEALYHFGQKVMHHPTRQLRKAAQQEDFDVLNCATQLFALEDLE